MNNTFSFTAGLKSLNRIEKLFFIILQFNLVLLLYLTFHFYSTAILTSASFCVVFTAEMVFLFKYNNKEKYLQREIALVILLILLLSLLPCCFLATASITYYGKRYDKALLEIDNKLLGSFFPHGQLSLYLDTNNKLGPHTILGQIIGSILQVFYFFYYLVPYQALYLHLLMQCIREIVFRYKNMGEKSKTYSKNWSQLFLAFSTYNLVIIFIFFINTLVPAESLRIYFQDKFTRPLELPGIAGFLNSKCKDNKSANSFPSGHVAETGCFAVFYMLIGNTTGFILCFITCFLLSLGTIWLRYHYFIDAVVGAAIAIFCPIFCYIIGYKPMNIYEDKEEDISRTVELSQSENKGKYMQQVDVI